MSSRSTGPGSMPSAWSEVRFSLGFPLFHSRPRNQMCPPPHLLGRQFWGLEYNLGLTGSSSIPVPTGCSPWPHFWHPQGCQSPGVIGTSRSRGLKPAQPGFLTVLMSGVQLRPHGAESRHGQSWSLWRLPGSIVSPLFQLLEAPHPWLVGPPSILSQQCSISCLPASDPPPPSSKDPIMTMGPLEIQGPPNLRGLKLIPPAKSPLTYEVTWPQASGPGWGHLWGCYSADQTQNDTHCLILLTGGPLQSQIPRDRK